MMRSNSDLLSSNLEEFILILLKSQDLHGWAIFQALNENRDSKLSFGSLYPALHRMQKRGLIASEWELDASNRRLVYSITKLGRKSLDATTDYRNKLRPICVNKRGNKNNDRTRDRE